MDRGLDSSSVGSNPRVIGAAWLVVLLLLQLLLRRKCH